MAELARTFGGHSHCRDEPERKFERLAQTFGGFERRFEGHFHGLDGLARILEDHLHGLDGCLHSCDGHARTFGEPSHGLEALLRSRDGLGRALNTLARRFGRLNHGLRNEHAKEDIHHKDGMRRPVSPAGIALCFPLGHEAQKGETGYEEG